MPSLAAHHAGTVALLGAFAELTGGQAPLELLGDPSRFSEEAGLKYDAYLTTGGAWGFTVNSRGEGARVLPRFRRFAGDDYDWSGVEALWERLGGVLTLGVGFDRPGAPPRLKLYFQEDAWGVGLASRAKVEAETGPLPAWLGDRIDVVTLQLHAGGARSWKVYVGWASPGAPGGPPEVQELARRMAEASPAGPAWYYVTVRLDSMRYAVNKIYPGSSWEMSGTPAWRDVAGLFRAQGREADLERLLGALDRKSTRLNSSHSSVSRMPSSA